MPRNPSFDQRGGRRENEDRDYDYRYTRDDEGDSSVRAGSYDQGRAQYGGRDHREQGNTDNNEQSGSTGRYAGYGDFGQGDYSGGRHGDTGQGRYGQSGYGQGGYGQRSGNYSAGNYGSGGAGNFGGGNYGGGSNYGYDRGQGRQGGYGGNYGEGRYGEGGSRSRFELGASRGWRGHGVEGDYGTGSESGGRGQDRYSQGTFGTERGGWNEPYGEGQGQGQGQNRGMGLHRGKGPKGYQRSDERLKEMICERLREDPDIDASEVSINVQGGRVTLDGTVDSRHAKNMVEDVAEQFGVSDVQNNLRVQRQETGGQSQGTQAQGRTGSTTNEQSKQRHN
jgi:osmotically-inducible protein OsmY